MVGFLELIRQAVWGVPTVLLIAAVGIYYTWKTRFLQVVMFPKACKNFFEKLRGSDESKRSVSAYQAFCTALAATVGTGNLAGVAGAISIGGPGAVFWMWVCAFLGMITKYAEAVLSVKYRKRNERGEWVGGPMYAMQYGIKRNGMMLARVYCFFGIVAALGVGNAIQINTVVGSFRPVLSYAGLHYGKSMDVMMGIGLAILVGAVLFGGAKKIGRITECLVPVASCLYIALCVGVLIICRDQIMKAVDSIFVGAFSPEAVTGGVIGSLFTTIRIGASRGIFTNEAGMGTAGIAHAGADVNHPVEQGLMGIMEVFLDTIVICTLTALAILCSGVNINFGTEEGIDLTGRAFSEVYGTWVNIPLALTVCTLALATVFGWGLYGGRCAEFLFGEKIWKKFCICQVVAVVFGAVIDAGSVWITTEIVNGLMMFPNLVMLLMLAPEVIKLTNEYKMSSSKKRTTIRNCFMREGHFPLKE